MYSSRQVSTVAMLIVAIVAIASHVRGISATFVAPTPTPPTDIAIGYMGDFADVALHEEMYSYARLAVEIINDKNSPWHADLLVRLGLTSLLPSHRLLLVGQDSKCNRGGGVRAALVLANECSNAVQVAATLGTFCSSASIGAQDLFRISKTPQVSYGATSPRLSDKNQYPYFARTVPPDDQQAKALLAFLQESSVTRAGVISFDDAYTKGIADAFRDFAPEFDVTVPAAAKVVLGFLTNSVYGGVKQVHGDLTLVCRLREMDALGIKHTLIALQTRGDLLYFVSAILQTGYLRDTQLYFTEVLDSPAIDAWTELESWQAWYTGHGFEALNGWWNVPGESEPVPMYVKNGVAVHSLSLATCKNLIGTVETLPSGARVITLEGKKGTLDDTQQKIVWDTGEEWTKRPHASQNDLMNQIVGGIGSTFLTAGQDLSSWFLPTVWQTVDPSLYPDVDGDRSSVTAYTPAVFDATVAIAQSIDALITQGLDYMDGDLLYASIKASRFTGLSGDVGFDQYGDRANATYILFNYQDWYQKRTVASVSGTSIVSSGVAVVYAKNATVPLPDGGCHITDASKGEVCSGFGTCIYGRGVCECDFEHLGDNCETYIPLPCTLDDTALNVGVCSSENMRLVTTRFVNSCCNSQTFPGYRTRCDSGIFLPPPKMVECDHIMVDSDIAVALFAVGVVGIAVLAAFIILVLIKYNAPEMIMGQPPFLIVCCIGGIIGLSSILLYAGTWTTLRCRLLATLPSVGFTVMLTSVVLKAWRVDAIFNNKSLYMMNVGPGEMLKRFAGIVSIDIVLLLLFLLVNDVHASTHEETVEGKIVQYTECTADTTYFGYVCLLFKFVLMLYGVMLALRVRSANKLNDFAESRFIMVSIYNTAAVALVGAYLVLFSDLDVEARYTAFSVCSLLIFTITPLVMIVPRVLLKTKVSPNDSVTTAPNFSTKGGFNLTTAGESGYLSAELKNQPNEQLFEMLGEQQEEIRQLKVMLASGQKVPAAASS